MKIRLTARQTGPVIYLHYRSCAPVEVRIFDRIIAGYIPVATVDARPLTELEIVAAYLSQLPSGFSEQTVTTQPAQPVH